MANTTPPMKGSSFDTGVCPMPTSNGLSSSYPVLSNGHLNSAPPSDWSTIDPLQLPHRNYSNKYRYQMLSNGYAKNTDAKRSRSRHSHPPSSTVAARLNVDSVCFTLWLLIVIFCTFLYVFLNPYVQVHCGQQHCGWIHSSNWLVLLSVWASAGYLIIWFLFTRSRYFRLQSLFVAVSVAILLLASANALWAISSFFQPNCQEIEIIHRLRAFNLTRSLSTLIEDPPDVALNYDDHSLHEFGTGILITPVPNQKELTNAANSTEDSVILGHDQLEWFEKLVQSYDLKLMGVFHWAISLFLISCTLRLLAKRRRFVIDSLKSRGLLIQYYWATLD